MNPRFLLDANVVSYFLQAGREQELSAAAGRLSLHLVDEVRQELERDRKRGGKAFAQWLAGSGLTVLSLEIGSDAASTLQQLLRPGDPQKDLGERACVALAAADPSLTLVTHDKNGAWIAIREIWRGAAAIMGIAPFLRTLFEQGALKEPAIADEVIQVSGPPEQRPTWWADWRAGLAGAAPPSG